MTNFQLIIFISILILLQLNIIKKILKKCQSQQKNIKNNYKKEKLYDFLKKEKSHLKMILS